MIKVLFSSVVVLRDMIQGVYIMSNSEGPSSSKIDLTEKLRFFIVKSLLVFVNFFKQVI